MAVASTFSFTYNTNSIKKKYLNKGIHHNFSKENCHTKYTVVERTNTQRNGVVRWCSDVPSHTPTATPHHDWEFVSSQRQSRFERATRSLATFVRSHRSLRSLAPQRSASLRSLRSLAPFTGSLTHFAHSLVGQLKFLDMCSRCYRVPREKTRFSSSLETRP